MAMSFPSMYTHIKGVCVQRSGLGKEESIILKHANLSIFSSFIFVDIAKLEVGAFVKTKYCVLIACLLLFIIGLLDLL